MILYIHTKLYVNFNNLLLGYDPKVDNNFLIVYIVRLLYYVYLNSTLFYIYYIIVAVVRSALNAHIVNSIKLSSD